MNEQTISNAQQSIGSLLDALKISRVVYVDDANEEAATLEDVIAAARMLDGDLLTETFPELGNQMPDDYDIRSKRIRDAWKSLDRELVRQRAEAVLSEARRQDGGEPDDLADVSILNQLIPEDILINLSPSEWEEQREDLLRANSEARTLFLFDRDFSETGGDTEGGMRIIASLLSQDASDNLMCGLLTHTVTPETQAEQWESLSQSHDIPRDRFVVIPKLHLSKAPMLFAQTLKFAALSPEFTKLKRETKDIIAKAADAAADRVEEVSIYDLDHIVFQVSGDEGLWEPDMLFRLHSMFHHLESRRLAHEGNVLESIAAKLRDVSQIPTHNDLIQTPGSAWSLQREELYEDIAHLNGCHLPLDLGDIFERVGSESSKKFILLAQPCDLMVRGDGKRYPEFKRFSLFEVVNANEEPYYAEELPYFDCSPENRWFVKFKLVHFVPADVLDLCVFNKEGRASIEVEGEAPQQLRPGWKKRHDRLSRHWRRKIRQLSKLYEEVQPSGEISERVAGRLAEVVLKEDLFRGKLRESGAGKTVSYECQRIGRLCRSRAMGLLMSYTGVLARPAYEREFVRVK